MSDSLAGLAINVDVSKVKAAIEALDALALKAGEVEKKVSKVGVGSNNQVNNRVIQEEKRVTNEIEKINKQNVNARRIAAEQVIAIERAKMNATSQHFTAMDLAENRRLVKWQDFQNKINKGLDAEVAAREKHVAAISRFNGNLARFSDDYYKKQEDLRKKNAAAAAASTNAEIATQTRLERALQASQSRLNGIIGRANRQLPQTEASAVIRNATDATRVYEQALRSFGPRSLEAAQAQGTFNRAMQNASGEIARQGGLLRTLNNNASTLNSAFGGAGASLGGFGRIVFQTSAAIASLAGAFALREIAQSIMEFERFSNTLRTVSGSTGEFQQNLGFLVAEANRIGFSVGEVGNAFARFSLAMTGAGFSSTEVRGSFSQLAESSRNLGLSSAETTGVIRALEQSMSKGKFMAEEVRLQLGDRLPFAMAALTRAVTIVDGKQSDINKRFEEGTLDVRRYGIEFIRQLNAMSGGAEALSRTSNSVAAAFGRLGTEFSLFSTALGQGGMNSALIIFADNLQRLMTIARESGALDILGRGLELVAKNLDVIATALTTLVALFGARAIMAFITMIANLNPVVRGATIGIGALTAAVQLFNNASTSQASASQNFTAALNRMTPEIDRVNGSIDSFQALLMRGAPLTDNSASAADRHVAANMRLGDSFLEAARKAAEAQAQMQQVAAERARQAQQEAVQAQQAYLAANPAINAFNRPSRIREADRRNALGGGLTLQPGQETTVSGLTISQETNVRRYIDDFTNLRTNLTDTLDRIRSEFSEGIPRSVERLLVSLSRMADDPTFQRLEAQANAARVAVDGVSAAAERMRANFTNPMYLQVYTQGLENQGATRTRADGSTTTSLSGIETSTAEAIRAAGSPRTRLAAIRSGLQPITGQLGVNLESGRDLEILQRLQNSPSAARLVPGVVSALRDASATGRTAGGPGNAVAEAVRDLRLQADKAGNDPGAASAYADAIRRVQDASTNAQGSVASLAAEEDARAAVTRRLTREMDLAIRTMDREIANNGRLANAYAQSNAAGREMEIAIRAETEARKYALAEGERTVEQIAKYEEAVARLTEKIRDLDTSEKNVAISRQLSTGRNDLEVLEREGQLITANVSTRNAEIAVLRARQQYAGADEAFLSRLETQIRQTEELRTRNEQLTNSWTEVSRLGEQAFERIGSAITEAFAQGKLDGLNFKNVMKAVFSEVAQAALKLAIINPILNAAFGGTRGTIGGVFGALGAGGVSGIAGLSGGVAGGAPGTIVVNGMNYMAAGQQASQQASLFGLGRMTGLGTALGGGYANTGFASVNNVLNTSVWGNTPTGIILGAPEGATGAAASAANQLAGTSTFAPGSTGTSGLNVGGAIGGAAGIAGGAYGIYSGVQKGGLGGGFQVAGGATSAVMGALQLAGMSLGPPGWIAAAILSIAGALLPGAKPSGMGQTAYENVDTGAEGYAGLGGKRFSKGNLDNSKSAVGQIADLAREVGQRLGGAVFGSHVAVGTTNTKLYLDVAGRKAEFSNDETGSKDLAAKAGEFIIQQFREANRASGDYAKILNNSPDDITKLTENLDWYEKVFKTFGESITPVSEFQKSLDDLNAQFQVSIDKANSLGLSTEKINEARDKEIEKLKEQRNAQLTSFDKNIEIRTARLMGNNELADLLEFDIGAKAQMDQTKTFLESLGITAEDMASRIANNEWVLAQERLDIQKKYANEVADTTDTIAASTDTIAASTDTIAASTDTIAASLEQLNSAREKASGSISNLVEYARSLSFGDMSTLSSQSKFDLALNQFNSVSALAKQGDAKSVTSLRSYAEQLLTSGRDMYGSGAGYASVFNDVLSAITQVSSLNEDTLTASFMAQISETATQTLAGELQALRAEVVGLRTQVAQQQNAPARS